MIGGMTEHTGRPALAIHLAKLGDNETVEIRMHGLSADTIVDAIAELRLMGLGCRTRKPLLHTWASPGQTYSETDWENHRAALEAEFGLEGFPCVEIFHLKFGKGGRTAGHVHRVYLRVAIDGRAVRTSHSAIRQEKVSRIAEVENGERLTSGCFNKPVMARLRWEGRDDVADAMVLAGLAEAKAVAAASSRERAMTERLHDFAADEVWRRAAAAWRRYVSVFLQLHPALRFHIVNTMGWSDLRPTQRDAIAPIHGGEDVLLLAPTAGGKTEAAFLPLLSRAANQSWTGLSVLYLCPLKALLNNLEPRLSRYAGFVGRKAGLWHGDVSGAARKRMLSESPDVLLTTPESVEAMLVSTRVDHLSLFSSLRAVVIDELHAFAGDDRGWHLLAILARLERLTGRRLQRIGLSATVGNPDDLLAWLTRNRGGRIVGSSAGPPTGDVQADYVGSVENAVTVLSRVYKGERRLVFSDSRARVEELASGLPRSGVRTFVSHGSLSADERRQAEAAFSSEPDCAIVATSTMELGIDVGDLDRVIQVGAPPSVSSFLQRMGRSGRRTGTVRNFLSLSTNESELLLNLGIARLWRKGFVENVTPPALPAHLYAQQIMALALQEKGIAIGDANDWLGTTFEIVKSSDQADIINHMIANEMLHLDGGVLGLGTRAEREFGRRHFGDLVVSFSSPMLLKVMLGRAELGSVHPLALTLPRDGEANIILLAGRSWRVTDVDWPRRIVFVVGVAGEGRARWLGSARPASYTVCRSVEAIIGGAHPGCELSRRAVTKLQEVREQLTFVEGVEIPVIDSGQGNVRIWTFAGGLTNAALAEALPAPASRSDDFYISVKTKSVPAAMEAFSKIDGIAAYPSIASALISALKFSSCLPKEVASATIAARLTDRDGIQATLSRRTKAVYDV
ncbi:ATP-dependent Lhr-like helicase [Nitrobacteraceae bacterium AZCC 2146]